MSESELHTLAVETFGKKRGQALISGGRKRIEKVLATRLAKGFERDLKNFQRFQKGKTEASKLPEDKEYLAELARTSQARAGKPPTVGAEPRGTQLQTPRTPILTRNAGGAMIGVEPDYDEDGNVIGLKYDPVMGGLGFGTGMLALSVARRLKMGRRGTVRPTTPKTKTTSASKGIAGMNVLAEREITKRATINLSFENPIRTFDRLGAWATENLYRPIKRAEKVAEHRVKRVRDKIKKIRKGNTRRGSSKNIMVYATSLQKGGLETLASMGVKDIPKLTLGEMKIYQTMRGELEKVYNRIQKARIAAGLEPFKKVENYFTFFRNLDAMEKQGYGAFGLRANQIDDQFVKESARRFGFSKPRGEDKERILHLDALGVFDSYIDAAYKHTSLSPTLSRIRGLIEADHGNGWKLMEQNPEAYNFLNQWTNFLAGDVKHFLPRSVNKVLMKLNKNLAFAVLSYNARSAGIQVAAGVHASTLVGPRYMMRGIGHLFNPAKRKFAWRRSNVLQGRMHDAAFVETSKAGGLKQKIGQTGMAPLQASDKEMAMATWLGAHEKGMRHFGMNNKQAGFYADDIVIKSQASAARSDIAPIQRTPEGKSVTNLQTFVINEWGFLRRDVLGGLQNRNLSKKEIAARLGRFLAGATLANIVYEDILGVNSPFPSPINAYLRAIERGGDEMDGVREAGKELLSPIPVIGGALRYSSSPLGPVYNLTENIQKHISGNKREYKKPLPQIAGEALGVPGTAQAAKILRYYDKKH